MRAGAVVGAARSFAMSFSIDYGFGPIGGLLIVFIISAALIALTFLVAAARRARRQALEDEGDEPDLIA
jgi:hypothetical protein